MLDPTPTSGNPFWDYSLALYAAPGVAEACIGLQDRHGLDVNLLLFCCWASHRGHGLSGDELDRLLAVSRDWQTEVVQPLRRLRRRLKAEAAASADVAALRDSIKAQELAAERIAQDRLQDCLPLDDGPANEAALASNLARYLSRVPAGVAALDDPAFVTLRAACL